MSKREYNVTLDNLVDLSSAWQDGARDGAHISVNTVFTVFLVLSVAERLEALVDAVDQLREATMQSGRK